MNGKLEDQSAKVFPFFRFKGTHRQIGQQMGEACAPLIRKNLEQAIHRLEDRFEVSSRQLLKDGVLAYRPYVQQYAGFLDEEVVGMAEGARISLEEAYFLQLRAEINQYAESHNECTTFAVMKEATANGVPLIGQNADLPAFYSELGVVVELIPHDGPSVLMLTPAGQVSYIGINDIGLGVFANFLTCEGWRVGFPRYMLSRAALTCGTVQEALQLIRKLPRASSRNLIMQDKHGGALDFENTPERDQVIEPIHDLLVHSNHYLAEGLLQEERLSGIELDNSKVRLERMRSLLEANHGKLNSLVMQEILRDRGSYPHCLCQIPGDTGMQAPGDKGPDIITFASVIAEPSQGQMWIAVGPPNQYEYKCYSFSNR